LEAIPLLFDLVNFYHKQLALSRKGRLVQQGRERAVFLIALSFNLKENEQ